MYNSCMFMYLYKMKKFTKFYNLKLLKFYYSKQQNTFFKTKSYNSNEKSIKTITQFSKCKKRKLALACFAQWVECWPMD